MIEVYQGADDIVGRGGVYAWMIGIFRRCSNRASNWRLVVRIAVLSNVQALPVNETRFRRTRGRDQLAICKVLDAHVDTDDAFHPLLSCIMVVIAEESSCQARLECLIQGPLSAAAVDTNGDCERLEVRGFHARYPVEARGHT